MPRFAGAGKSGGVVLYDLGESIRHQVLAEGATSPAATS